jgi:hypothetical protein
MSHLELQERIFLEIRKIPESKLPEAFDIIHFWRENIVSSQAMPDSTLQALQAITSFRGSGPKGAAQMLLEDRQTDRLREP